MMKMLNRQLLKERVVSDYHNGSIELNQFDEAIGALLLEIVEKLPQSEAEGKAYSVGKVRKLVETNIPNEQILAALNYLTTSRAGLFKTSWFLMGEDYSVELEVDEFSRVMSSNQIAHPETGEIIENAKECVFLLFIRVADFE